MASPVSVIATPAMATTPAQVETIKSCASASQTISLECDYDANPTELYQALEAKQWDFACKCVSHPSGATQAATWVTRKEKNGKLRWRLLPVHAAIIFGAPLKVVDILLQEYPLGAHQKDDQGMLPLHLAFRNDADWNVLEELLKTFPQSVSVKDRKGRTPIQCASEKMKSFASILDLYSQIVVSGDRQNAVTESRVALDSRVSAMQEQHVNTLMNLKGEWELQRAMMTQEVDDTKKALAHTAIRLQEAQAQLTEKSQTEAELTHKLGMVTLALQSANTSRAVESTMGDAANGVVAVDTTKQVSTQVLEESHLRQANEDLVFLVQTLLDQQMDLKLKLDAQAYTFKDHARKKVSLLRELDELNRLEEEQSSMERNIWRSKLGESNESVSRKLRSVLETIGGASSRGGKGPGM